MATDITTYAPAVIALPDGLPDMITAAGAKTAWRFVEFFTVTIRNPNTREAYTRAVSCFLSWCEGRGLYDLYTIKPMACWMVIRPHP